MTFNIYVVSKLEEDCNKYCKLNSSKGDISLTGFMYLKGAILTFHNSTATWCDLI